MFIGKGFPHTAPIIVESESTYKDCLMLKLSFDAALADSKDARLFNKFSKVNGNPMYRKDCKPATPPTLNIFKKVREGGKMAAVVES